MTSLPDCQPTTTPAYHNASIASMAKMQGPTVIGKHGC